MPDGIDRHLLRRAVATWGFRAQLDMLQEECGELVAAVNRLKRGRISPAAVAEEVADVLLMCEQARVIVAELRNVDTGDASDIVEEWLKVKQARLRKRLDEAEGRTDA